MNRITKLIKKFIFLWGKPCIIIAKGVDFPLFFDLTSTILKPRFKAKKLNGDQTPFFINSKEVLVSEKEPQGLDFFLIENEVVKEINNKTSTDIMTYGFKEGETLFATDINIGEKETNFKVNYQCVVVPFWIPGLTEKEKIPNVLAAICVGIIKNINLVEISQALKNKNSV